MEGMKSKKQRIQNRNRQRLLSNNHATCTAFLMGLLSKYVDLEISYPNKLSSLTLIFPKLKFITFPQSTPLDIYSLISNRIEIMRKQKKEEKNEMNKGKKLPRLNFERRYEMYHYIYDLLNMYEEVEIYKASEEHGGISGEYKIEVNGKEYLKEMIDEKGREILRRVYKEKKGGRLRVKVNWEDINDLYL